MAASSASSERQAARGGFGFRLASDGGCTGRQGTGTTGQSLGAGEELPFVRLRRALADRYRGAQPFLAEILTTANLQHQHILARFDSGGAVAS